MADTAVFFPGRTGPIPIKAADQGDGTYCPKTTALNGSGTVVFVPGRTGIIPVKAVDQGDGTYALLVTEG